MVIGRTFAEQFNIHRTRRNFPNNGLTTFNEMADIGVAVTERAIVEQAGGKVDASRWRIPELVVQSSATP